MINIIESPHLTADVLKKMCRSKKKRIRKKWLKNKKNYTTGPDTTHVYQIKDSNSIMCHPIVAEKIREAIIDSPEMPVSFNGKFISNKPFGFDYFNSMPELKPTCEPEHEDRFSMSCGVDFGYPNSFCYNVGVV